MEIITAVAVALAGLIFGSFLNVCIYRIPVGESIITGRSHCTSCGKPIRNYDLIPVLSFVILRGRCRDCGKSISPRYPLVEQLNAVLYVSFFLIYGLTPAFVIYSLFASALVVASLIDIDKQIIPDRLNVFIIIIGITAIFFSHDIAWYDRLIGFFAAGLPLFIGMLVTKGNMGFGDVKLAAAAGLVLGYRLALFSLLAAFVVGAVFGVIYMLAKRKGLKTAIPFGPFLSLAFCLSLVCGNPVISAYLGLFNKF